MRDNLDLPFNHVIYSGVVKVVSHLRLSLKSKSGPSENIIVLGCTLKPIVCVCVLWVI